MKHPLPSSPQIPSRHHDPVFLQETLTSPSLPSSLSRLTSSLLSSVSFSLPLSPVLPDPPQFLPSTPFSFASLPPLHYTPPFCLSVMNRSPGTNSRYWWPILSVWNSPQPLPFFLLNSVLTGFSRWGKCHIYPLFVLHQSHPLLYLFFFSCFFFPHVPLFFLKFGPKYFDFVFRPKHPPSASPPSAPRHIVRENKSWYFFQAL